MAKGKQIEIPFPDKTDTDLAIEILFDKHGVDDARKQKLGIRWSSAQDEVNSLLSGSKTNLLVAIRQYLKKHGCEDLI